MADRIYWGECGQYGPYSIQGDGWPNGGEVVQDYHKRSGLPAKEIAKRYSALIGATVTEEWIYKMEQRNKVPNDINRRRALMTVLSIPPALLGLASLENITKPQPIPVAPHLQFSSLEPDQYKKEARVLWKLHYTSTAQDSQEDVLAYIGELEKIEKQAKGDLLRNACEILNSLYRLMATMNRDQGNFTEGYKWANEGVRVAKLMGYDPYSLHILAASFYTRGMANLAWGAFGYKEKVEAALADFQKALPHARPQLTGIIWTEMARAKSLIRVSPSDTTIVLSILEKADRYVGVESGDDFYTQILFDGDIRGLDKRRLIIGRAKTFLSLDLPGKAIAELDNLEDLGGAAHTRRRVWIDILYAQASFKMKDYPSAAQKGIEAFLYCQEIGSTVHLTRIQDIHKQLLASSYKGDSDVRRLGDLLNKYLKTGL